MFLGTLLAKLFLATLLGNLFLEPLRGNLFLGTFGHLAWEPFLGTLLGNLLHGNLAWEPWGTCSWEPFEPVLGSLAWEPLGTFSWEPCLGTYSWESLRINGNLFLATSRYQPDMPFCNETSMTLHKGGVFRAPLFSLFHMMISENVSRSWTSAS